MLLFLFVTLFICVYLYFLFIENQGQLPKDKIEPEAFQTNIQKIVGSYKEDFLFKGLNKFSNLIEGSNVTDKDWKRFIKNDPKEMFKAETSKENKKSLDTKNLLFNQS